MSNTQTPNPNLNAGIPSVNSRGGTEDNGALKKMFFVFITAALVLVGGLYGFTKYRSSEKAKETQAETDAKNAKVVNKPAAVAQKRTFTEEPPTKTEPEKEAPQVTKSGEESCSDGKPSRAVLDKFAQPMMTPEGQEIRVCNDGKLLAGELRLPTDGTPVIPPEMQHDFRRSDGSGKSRYGGGIFVTEQGQAQSQTTTPSRKQDDVTDRIKNLLDANSLMGSSETPAAGKTLPSTQPQTTGVTTAGSLGSQLQGVETKAVTASMIGDRNMILPKGKTIPCVLSMRIISDIAGMATCVLTRDAYSDNGKVLLLERGSVATGEYSSVIGQGQKRIPVLWSRIKTPNGVIININSPASDALGTGGLDGYVDNHWGERIGAAYLLSSVDTALAYFMEKEKQKSGSDVSVYQGTSDTTSTIAERVLESTINIKPSIYKNQGDMNHIFVARDLDFGDVYALRSK